MHWELVRSGLVLLSVVAVALTPAAAMGALSANMEWDYSMTKFSSESADGTKRSAKTNDFRQRYNFGFDTYLYPTISVGLGYLLEKDVARLHTDGGDMQSTMVRMNPSAYINFSNPFVNAGVSYYEVETKSETRGSPPLTYVSDNFTANFGLTRRPDRPTLAIQYTWAHSFDKDHQFTDVVSETASLTSRYQVLKQLDIRYQGALTDTTDKLHSIESSGVNNSGRVTFNDSLFQRRVSVFSSYTINQTSQETTIHGSAGGEVTQTITPFKGLSGSGPLGTDVPPEVPTLDTLVENPLLIDGNAGAGSGVNIGYSPTVTDPRNMGLDLGLETELNSIYVWVNQRLPASIVNSFSWDIYISSDTANLKQWTLVQTVAPAPFGIFDARFELRFTNVTTRFIKVVTRPLASPVPVPGVDVNNILVTELQAFITTAVQPGGSKQTFRSTNQRLELGANVKIADIPNAYYSIYYEQAKSDISDYSPYQLVNKLFIGHRLSRVFAADATASRTDARERDGIHVISDYSASVTARPLNTLLHTLRASRRTDEVTIHKTVATYANFNNAATLYRGISVKVNFSEGDTMTDGRQTRDSTVTAGSTLVPFRTMTINLYYTTLDSKSTGGELQDTSAKTKSTSANLSYSPYETLYLFGAYSTSWVTSSGDLQSRPTARTQNYNLSWAPSLRGALWFGVDATHTRTSQDDGKITTVSPNVRWLVNPYVTFEVSYQWYTTKNISETTEQETAFAVLRVRL